MRQKTTTILKPATNSPSLFSVSRQSNENEETHQHSFSNESFVKTERRLSKTYSNHHAMYLDPNEDRPE